MREWIWVAALTCLGCAQEAVPEPEMPVSHGRVQPLPTPPPAVGTTWGDVAGWRGASNEPARVPAPPPAAPLGTPRARSSPSAAIPGGPACLGDLARLGVAFQSLDTVKGISTPVRVVGPIGGLRFRAVAGMQLVLDCRLAVALA